MLVAGLVLGGLYHFLHRVGETTGPVTAARLQEAVGDLYGPALIYRPFAYKLERYRLRKPEILLVGSSRVMPFAGEVFTAPVLNAGGAANTLDQTVAFTRQSVSMHKPKAILLGLDFWWFNPNRDDEIDATGELSDSVEMSLEQIAAPATWVIDGKMHLSSLIEGAVPFTHLPQGIGAFAKFGGRGWDIYGRYNYGTLIDGGSASDDRQFKRTLKRLQSAKKSSKLNVRVAPSAESLQELQALIAELKAQSIEVTLLLPPLARPVYDTIYADAGNRMLPLWRDAMVGLGAPIFDFTDPASIASDQCEFVDGFHGGEVTYLRILQAIANYGGSTLSRSIDRDMVSILIANNRGLARVVELQPAGVPAEIDFLNLGCNKAK